MNLLCLIDSLGSGGGQRQLVNLAVLWKQKGHGISFACYHRDPFYLQLLEENGIEVTWIDSRSAADRIRKVRSYIRSVNPDILVSFLETPNFIACLSSVGKHRWKLITNERSAKNESFHGMRSRIFKLAEHFSDWTVCNSVQAMQLWNQYYPCYAHRISTIYNLISIPQPYQLQAARFQPDARKRLVIAASYQSLKNPLAVIEAVSLLEEEERSAIRIDWYGRQEVTSGNSEVYRQARRKVEDLGLTDVISLHGETKNIYSEIACSDGVGLFSTVEGFPNAVCEAMVLGKPVLMTKVSDYSRLVTPENGFLCKGMDPQSIRECLSSFIAADRETLAAMGTASRTLAETLFSRTSVMAQWEALFEALTNDNKKRV